jgi:hypothetical protein
MCNICLKNCILIQKQNISFQKETHKQDRVNHQQINEKLALFISAVLETF